MTGEEAIEVLRTECVEIGGNAVNVARFFEALDMAISALRQQEQESEMVPKRDMEIILNEVANRSKPMWISVNADCPMCADYCPVVDVPGVCRFEEREDTNEQS